VSDVAVRSVAADLTDGADSQGSSSRAQRGAVRALRILFVQAADELYGSDRVLLSIVRGLDRARFAPQVVVPNDLQYEGLLSAELNRLGVPVRSMRLGVLRRKYFTPAGTARLARDLAAATATLVRVIRDERIDVVHTHTAAVLAGALAARLTRRPHIWHVSEIVTRPSIVRRLLSWAVPALSDRVVAVSHAVRDHLASGDAAALAKCDVIYNGIDASRFHPSNDGLTVRRELGIPAGRPVVGMVGRVGTWKGQELLLDAAPRVLERHPDALFLLVGGVLDGRRHELEALRRRAAAAGLGASVVVSDFRHDTPSVHAAIDVFVQPSVRPDPLPTTILEAMATGRPVVAADHGGAPEMVAEGDSGFLVPPGRPEALAARIGDLLDSAALRARMGVRGRSRVEREFSMSRFVGAYARGYEALAGRRAGTR